MKKIITIIVIIGIGALIYFLITKNQSLKLSIQPDTNQPRTYIITGPSQLISELERAPGRDVCGGSYIDWGDSKENNIFEQKNCNALLSHTYDSPGTFTVTAHMGTVGPTDKPEITWEDTFEIVVK